MSTTETTLHQILQIVIIDGFQRMRPESDIKSSAEAAARALRAGLAAFTAPSEALVGGSVNASIPATVNYGGTKDAAVQHSAIGGRFPASTAGHIDRAAQQNAESMARLATLKRMADAAACDQDHGLAAWVLLLSQAGAAPLKASHSAACAPTSDAAQCGCCTATSVQASGSAAVHASRGMSKEL